ncbi:MAG: hypothetical protein V3W34_17755 [Phycisphaerae bacterium]
MKKIPRSLLALGPTAPPKTIRAADKEFHFVRLLKHDFFAATAVYQGDAGRVIAKFGRTEPILGLPAQWIGRLLAWHEATIYAALADLEAVPAFVGRCGPTGIVHEFIEGAPLTPGQSVPDAFFDRLREAVDALHARGMAYVDLEKRQNVIAGDDGRPYLIDFQISWYLPRRYGGETLPARWLRRRFQEGDRYHLLKLQRRIRRDQLTAEQIRQSYRKPFHVKLHRWLTWPMLKTRRTMLQRLDPTHKRGERGSAV